MTKWSVRRPHQARINKGKLVVNGDLSQVPPKPGPPEGSSLLMLPTQEAKDTGIWDGSLPAQPGPLSSDPQIPDLKTVDYTSPGVATQYQQAQVA